MKFDLLSIGDATIDTFLFIKDATVNCSIKKDSCQFCFNYGDKLPVERVVKTVAGNAANNAIGSARLGFKTGFVTLLGDDDSGQWISKKLKSEGVNTKFVQLDKKLQTNASTVLSFEGERTIFVYHAPRKYALPKEMPDAKFVYYTSVGENHERLNTDVVRYIKKTGAKLGFNPGTYQLRSAASELKKVIGVTQYLFVNKEEARTIVGEQSDIKSYLRELHKLGAAEVIITDGKNGSFVFAEDQFFTMGIPDTKVVERTGAGDSFATAYIAARAEGKKVTEAMCAGTMNSSSVIMYVGPQEGLLTKKGIAAFHKKTKHSCAKAF